jgi:hypothetical protein
MSDTINADGLEDWLGEAPAPDKLQYLEERNNRRIEIKKQFDAWFGEEEGYSFRYERFWDDFDSAKDKNDYNSMKLMVKWLRTAFEMGYHASESKLHSNEDTCSTGTLNGHGS